MRLSGILWILFFCFSTAVVAGEQDWEDQPVMIVTAEGLADGHFYQDRRVAYDEAIKDAKRQVLEKAVGAFVDSHTRVANYQTITDTIHTRYQGFIKDVIAIVDDGLQPDGFYHVWLKAEIYTRPLQESLGELSRDERRIMIQRAGNPTFAVNIDIRSEETGGFVRRCQVCETEIAGRLVEFGYRLMNWQAMARDIRLKTLMVGIEQGEIAGLRYGAQRKSVDVMITGQVKLRQSLPVEIAGVPVRTTLLTSWSVQALATQTNEIIFSRNFRPEKRAFNDSDHAIMAVGEEIGELFSNEVFEDYVASPVRTLTLALIGIPERRLARDMKRDLLSARSITGVRFKDFYRHVEALFEIDYVGTREEFAQFLDAELLTALNRKYGAGTFVLTQESGDQVTLRVMAPDNVSRENLLGRPPLYMTVASAERVNQVVKSPETFQKVSPYNHELAASLDDL